MTNTEALKTQHSRRILRRIGAVLAGLLTVFILDFGIDVLLHKTRIYPPWFKPMSTRLWLLAVAYRIIDGITGGYVAARLAPARTRRDRAAVRAAGRVAARPAVAGAY